MGTKGSREQDEIVRRASREMKGVEHERNNATGAGPDTRCSGSIGGGDREGRRGKIWSGDAGARKSKDE